MKKRILSILVMSLIFIPALLLGGIYFKIMNIIIAFMMVYELIKARNKNYLDNKLSLILLSIFILLIMIPKEGLFNSNTIKIILTSMISFMLLTLYKEEFNTEDAMFYSAIIIFITLPLRYLVYLRSFRMGLVIYILLCAMLTDVFAYLGGSLVGKHKLYPKVSPKKTVEGSIIGIVLSSICMVPIHYYVVSNNNSLLISILVTLAMVTISEIGDLFFSKVKREYKIKDFSNLIPGHGGILDRMDSILFTTVLYYIISGGLV